MTSPLDLLLADGVIDEVLGRLKSGKEADISLVSQRGQVLAAKVYKDKATRSFKNNADYKEGRKTRNTRTQRAMDGGGKFGREAAEQAWKTAESTALSRLLAAGVRVPRPVIFYEGVLVMELVLGDDGAAAARLIDVALDPAAASKVFLDLRGQIIAMLCCDLIHGDLSPYNILAGAAGPTIIDFPQVISAAHSSRAQFFFQRDFDNVLRYVAGFDPLLGPRHAGDAHAIWRAYTGRFLTPEFVPPPMAPRPPPMAPRPRTEGRHPPRQADARQADARQPAGRQPDARQPAGRQPDARQPDARQPAGRQPDARRPDARQPDTRHPDARQPDARHPDARHPDARHPDARHPDARPPEARRPDARHPDGRHPDARHPDARHPDPRHPDARHPDARHPDARHPDARHPDARHPGPRNPDTRHPGPAPRPSGPRTAPPPPSRPAYHADRASPPRSDDGPASGGPRRRRPRRRS